MAVFSGQNYTGVQAINIKGSVVFRVGGFDANQGTMWINSASLESSRAWGLPDKTGIFGITGTFQISLPLAGALNNVVQSTIVTVSGIRAEDGLVCTLQGSLATAGIGIVGAVPGNGNVTVYVGNTSGGVLNVLDRTVAYTAVR